jgi:Holliday junction resolvase RusA-like endonuclease
MDAEIYMNYKLWPNNFIACDILNGNERFSAHYSPAEKETFKAYMEKELAKLQESDSLQQEIFLKIYATPVINAGISA